MLACRLEVLPVQLWGAGTRLERGEPTGPPLGDDRDPGSARLARTPSRWRRARKYILLGAIVLVVAVVGAGAGVYLFASNTLSSMRRIHDPFASIPTRQRPPVPAGPAGKDVTFLVGGVDTRSPVATTGKQAQSRLRGRTDTLMLVHLIAAGRGAYVVSIPRDSWVPIPGYGDGKVNWAYYFGGPSLAVRTVEKLTHVRINHVAVVDWAGFRDLTDVLGGVTIDIPVSSYDPANHVTWTKGVHDLNGAQALLYVRDRYGLTSGDFGREQRQQNFLRAVFWKLRDKVSPTNPLLIGSLLQAISHTVSVDSTLSNSDMEHLALSLRALNGGNILFATVPYKGTGQVGSQSVVELSPSLDRGFWHAFEYDTLPAFMQAHSLQPLGTTTP